MCRRGRVALLISLVVVGAVVLIGCGGDTTPVPPDPDPAAIEGQVDVAGAPGDYELLLDGRPVPGGLQSDGSYRIEGVAPGRHSITVVGPDGMTGGHASVEVVAGRRARAPEIVPELGGQIVGIVTVRAEDGVRALVGVEVAAQPAYVIAMVEDGTGDETEPGTAPIRNPDLRPPPDDLPAFSTFTDENGSFILRAVPEGEYVVTVAQPEMRGAWQWVWVAAGRTAVADFELRPEIEPGVGTVRGRVLGAGEGERVPLVGARVTIMGEAPWEPIGPPEICEDMPVRAADEAGGSEGDGEGVDGEPGRIPPDPDMICPPCIASVSTLTDAQGAYRLNAPSGWSTIEVWIEGWEPAWEEITILPGETVTKSFTLEPWGDGLPGSGPPPVPLPPGNGPEPPTPPGGDDATPGA